MNEMFSLINLNKLNINELETNDVNANEVNVKRKLDVYYCIDMRSAQEIEYIENILNLNIKINKREFSLNKFEHYKRNIDEKESKDNKNENDIIRTGLLTFNKMFRDLKLKSNNELWFIYISKGDIKEIYKDVFTTLINKNPSEKMCFYAINKNNIIINKTDNKDIKMLSLKEINKTINELLSSNNSITYKNLSI